MSQIKILIAENDTILSFYFKSLLIELGYESESIITADSGLKALSLSQKIKPDIIFMDITMEYNKDGIECCIALKKNDPSIKIVFSSAYPEDFFKDDFSDISYDDYIEKPFNLESIKSCLKKLGA